MFIHVRRYDRRDDGTLFPTKKGIALNLENQINENTFFFTNEIFICKKTIFVRKKKYFHL